MRWIELGSRTRRLTWRSPLVWALGATLALAACQSAAPAASPTTTPVKPGRRRLPRAALGRRRARRYHPEVQLPNPPHLPRRCRCRAAADRRS